MIWQVRYHPDVVDDLARLERPRAKQVLKAIEQRVAEGMPDRSGKALRGGLAGCRRVRVGDVRIVYLVDRQRRSVFILAVGQRRDEEVYNTAGRRLG